MGALVMAVQCVSFERSGHHFLIENLKRHAARRAGVENIPDQFTPFIEVGWLSYCEFYRHCRRVPCSHGALLRKNHDHHVNVLPHWMAAPETKHIVQWRHPVDSIISLYEWRLQRSRYHLPWVSFAADYGRRWCKWVLKWVHENRHQATVVLQYEHLVANTLHCVNEVLRLIGIDDPATDDDLIQVRLKNRDLLQWDIQPIVETTRAARELLGVPDEPRTIRKS